MSRRPVICIAFHSELMRVTSPALGFSYNLEAFTRRAYE
jgi:hypothetical protein